MAPGWHFRLGDVIRTAFGPNEWVAIFLKSYADGRVAQRVASISWVLSDPVQAWLRAMNAHRYNVYVSVNALREGSRSRSRDAIAAVRHVFLEADKDGDGASGAGTRHGPGIDARHTEHEAAGVLRIGRTL